VVIAANKETSMRPFSVTIFNQTTAGTGSILDVSYDFCLGIDMSWAGTNPVGTIVIEYCPDISVTTASTWRTLKTVTIGTDTSPVVEKVADVTFHFVRATLTLSSGTLSSCVVKVYGKGM
jgi:hypothetical protein